MESGVVVINTGTNFRGNEVPAGSAAPTTRCNGLHK